MTSNSSRIERASYPHFDQLQTRWMDNDIYGHVNNVVYYSYFDSVVNRYLIEQGGLDIHQGESVAYVVASSCQYRAPIAYPASLEIGLRVNQLGHSSVEYGLAVFEQGSANAAAYGTFTHVFVKREHDKSCEIPAPVKRALGALMMEEYDENQ